MPCRPSLLVQRRPPSLVVAGEYVALVVVAVGCGDCSKEPSSLLCAIAAACPACKQPAPSCASCLPGQSVQHSLRQHQEFLPSCFCVVVLDCGQGWGEGFPPRVPGSCRDSTQRRSGPALDGHEGRRPFAPCASARPAADARASGRHVGWMPYRVETLSPHTLQRCRCCCCIQVVGTCPARV